MVTEKEYKNFPISHWIGKKVVTLCELNNGHRKIPKYTVMKIKLKNRGFRLFSAIQCKHCGVTKKLFISNVKPCNLHLLGD